VPLPGVEKRLDGDGSGGEGRGTGELLVSGVIDLLVVHKSGEIDVIDYKRSRGPHPEIHAFQLAMYQRAARALFGDRPVRAGIVFLGAKGEPDFVSEALLASMSTELGELGMRFVRARARQEFPRVDVPKCRAIHCGYVPRCHG
jgi:ATP-dependent helicase/nuclease subunit A